jgi:hypothetical protein
MVDTLTQFNEKAPINLYLSLMYSVAVLTLGWISIVAFQQAKISLLATGLTFIPLAVFADWASQGKIFRSQASWGLLAFSFAAPILFIQSLGFLTGLEFSVYAVASEGFLASILAEAPSSIQTSVNVFIAAILETGVFVTTALISFAAMKVLFRRLPFFRGIGEQPRLLIAAIISAQPAAYAFQEMHGKGGFAFKVAAYLVMNIMLIPGLLEEVTSRSLTKIIGLGSAFIAGLHVGLNMSAAGGIFTVTASLLSVEGSVIVPHAVLLGFLYVSIFTGVSWAWNKTGGNFFNLRTLIRRIGI